MVSECHPYSIKRWGTEPEPVHWTKLIVQRLSVLCFSEFYINTSTRKSIGTTFVSGLWTIGGWTQGLLCLPYLSLNRGRTSFRRGRLGICILVLCCIAKYGDSKIISNNVSFSTDYVSYLILNKIEFSMCWVPKEIGFNEKRVY